MKKAILIIILFIPISFLFSQPLTKQENRTILLDIDCGVSDYRALNLFLYQDELEIAGIIISDGIVDPENGFTKVSSFLKEIAKDSIPIGVGNVFNKKYSSKERLINQDFRWSKTNTFSAPKRSARNLLSDILNKSEEKVVYICLGPLTSLGDLISQKPELIPKIDRLIWYNDHDPYLKGFNYEFDSLAAKKVFSSNLRIDVISNMGNEKAVFDISLVKNTNPTSPVSNNLSLFYRRNNKQESYNKEQLVLTDELVCIYFFNSYLFDMNPRLGRIRQRYNSGYNMEAVKEVISDLVHDTFYPEENIVFTKFPAERRMFSYDVRQIMDYVISRYGEDEWKACVITDEFHGHLGIYSIVGAKMGVKAREIFGVGMDMLQVVSYAGLKPPYSCLNDGIQVSTGSTLGLGLISISSKDDNRAMADFSYKGRTVRISLKDEYLEKVESDINEGIIKFGLMDDGYWKLVRQSSLRCWMEWDRNNIFNIEEITSE